MVPRAPPAVTPPPVLRPDWKTLARLASTWSKPLDLDACPMPSQPPVGFVAQPTKWNDFGFEAQTKKSVWWFWGPNHQTVVAGFEAQPRKPSTTLVLRLSLETVGTGSEAKPEKLSPPILRPNRRKPSQWFWGQTTDNLPTLVFRLNQETHAPHLHVHGANRTRHHPTSRSHGHRVPDMCDHPRSSTAGLLLLPWSSSLHTMPHLPPTHHETRKHDSLNEKRIKVK
jgi:hypothetical protein